MNFDERAYLRSHLHLEFAGERQIATAIYQMKNGAYEITNSGTQQIGRINWPVFVTGGSDATFKEVWEWVQANPTHEFRYGWEVQRPLLVDPKTSFHYGWKAKLSRPLVRLTVLFSNVETQNQRELYVWFDAVKLLAGFERVVHENKVLIYDASSFQLPAIERHVFFSLDFDELNKKDAYLVDLIDDLRPFVTFGSGTSKPTSSKTKQQT